MLIKQECEEKNIEVAFPRPACALDYTGQPILDNFIDYFKIGKPEVEVYIENDRVISCKVHRSAPCGSTWYICRQIVGKDLYELTEHGAEIISKAHHSFPCTASMAIDPVLGDTNLHTGGYLVREAVFSAIKKLRPDFNPKVITQEQII